MAGPAKVTDPAVWITEGHLKTNVDTESLGLLMNGVAGPAKWLSAFGSPWHFMCYEQNQEVVIAFDHEVAPEKWAIIESYRTELAE